MISSLLSWFAKPGAEKKSFDHNVNADISVVPIGSGTSISEKVNKAGRILARQGFKEVKTHGFGTNVSGRWSDVVAASENIAQNLLSEKNLDRFSINFKVSFRKDKPNQSIGKRLAKA